MGNRNLMQAHWHVHWVSQDRSRSGTRYAWSEAEAKELVRECEAAGQEARWECVGNKRYAKYRQREGA